MFDLGTLENLNDRAYEEYQNREKPTTPLDVLKERLRNTRPPSILILTGLFANAEDYNDFVSLVKEYLPERERAILEHPSPSAQIASFASYFEDRYLPLHPSFKDGYGDYSYSDLLRDIPIMVMGFGWEDYHALNEARLGVQLMSYLFEAPGAEYDDEESGERVALADGFPQAYQKEAQRVPANGITLDAAKRIFKGKKWIGLHHWANYINMATDNYFLDTDEEMLGNTLNGWSKNIVEAMSKEWMKANAYYDKMMNFAAWLEDEKEGPARFKEVVDFILINLEPDDIPKKIPRVEYCSRGLLRAPPQNNR